MPEGDTVWLAASRMHAALAGQPLTGTDFRVPALATTDLAGRDVLEVVPRGKHMLTRFEGGLTLHTHFRMDGTWHLYRPEQRWSGGAAWQIRAVLRNEHWAAVGYRLPVLELVATGDEQAVVGHLGPDLLGPDWDEAEAVRRVTAQPQRAIAEALLDQRNLAGIGNLYKTEVLFLRGLSPWTPVGQVEDVPALIALARRLMLANRDRWEQVTTGNARNGEHHWVFERAGAPCRRCGTRVLSAEQDVAPRQRLSYWCPSCQRGSAPPPDELRSQEQQRQAARSFRQMPRATRGRYVP